jgi:Ca-activated chloride channel family protein
MIMTVMLALLTVPATAQNRNISGVVTDESGMPFPFVNVYLESDRSVGTLTDEKGSYRITVPDKSTLVFAFVGYRDKKVKVGSSDILNVVMEPVVRIVDEVIAVAYAERNKSMAAGAMERRSQPAVYHDMWYSRPENREDYARINESGFRNVVTSPLSTFSIDVDNASYSNVRRFINNGQLPPADAVRIEEMINYFSYNYPQPSGAHPFSVYSEVASCPWNRNNLLLHIGLKGRNIDKSELSPSNIVFLIDVSGSMDSPNKLPLLKSAFRMLVGELRPVDRVAIVVYAGAAGVVLESTPGNRKEVINSALERLHAGGSTAGGAGLKLAYQVAGRHFIDGGNNRIILATDGDFNVGASSNSEMERMIERERERGIFMTVLGFGMGNYQDSKMEIIADKGNGNYAYIDNIQEARKVLVKEFGGTLFTIAKDVKFQIEFNPANVASYRLIGYENRLLNDEDFNDDRKDAGEMGSGHTVTALYEIVPAGSGPVNPGVDPLRYQRQVAAAASARDELATIKMRYKDPAGSESRLFEEVVRRGEKSFERSSEDFRFAASVAGFGMMLRDSEFRGDLSYRGIVEMASAARGEDEEGYRAEFIRLVSSASALTAHKH